MIKTVAFAFVAMLGITVAAYADIAWSGPGFYVVSPNAWGWKLFAGPFKTYGDCQADPNYDDDADYCMEFKTQADWDKAVKASSE